MAIRHRHNDTNGNVQMSNLPEPLSQTVDRPLREDVVSLENLWLR